MLFTDLNGLKPVPGAKQVTGAVGHRAGNFPRTPPRRARVRVRASVCACQTPGRVRAGGVMSRADERRAQEYKLFQQALKETPKGRWSHAGEKVEGQTSCMAAASRARGQQGLRNRARACPENC